MRHPKEEARPSLQAKARHALTGDHSIANGYPEGALSGFCAAWWGLWAFILVSGLMTGAI